MGNPLSYCEQMLLTRLDKLATEQQFRYESRHELCGTRFQHMDNKIEGIYNRLVELQFNRGN